MTSRSERHRQMAEKYLIEHQAMTLAHIEGRQPTLPTAIQTGPVTFYIPQRGESIMEGGAHFADNALPLRELELYWKRIPDFGIKRYDIFTSDSGWSQVLYWGGTGEDGTVFNAEEVDIMKTDENFRVTRFEIYSDAKQWRQLVAYVHHADPETWIDGNYNELIGATGGH